MAHAPKRAKVVLTADPVSTFTNETVDSDTEIKDRDSMVGLEDAKDVAAGKSQQHGTPKRVLPPRSPKRRAQIENVKTWRNRDVHAAIRKRGCRVILNSVDFDGKFISRS